MRAVTCRAWDELTECELNIPRLELLAVPVSRKLARKRGDILHEVVSNILQNLQKARSIEWKSKGPLNQFVESSPELEKLLR